MFRATMTRQPRSRDKHRVILVCVGPGAANLPARGRQTKTIGRAPTISHAAVATTPPSGGPTCSPAAPPTPQPRLKIPLASAELSAPTAFSPTEFFASALRRKKFLSSPAIRSPRRPNAAACVADVARKNSQHRVKYPPAQPGALDQTQQSRHAKHPVLPSPPPNPLPVDGERIGRQNCELYRSICV